MATLNEIRRGFLDYFVRNGHEEVASSPLVPQNDPTLMFTNAGMVQFKNVFTGLESRPYDRAATSQKCVRAGGKHNDLDNVGYTARHHTFFEMLGNFSFGDYFKEGAIPHAWELLTRDFGLPPEKLLVTVFHDDDAAADLWKKVAGLPDERIIRIATSDNFWSMGPTGPCGPCSEIFYDHGAHIPGGPPGSPDEDGDRFVEIWNLVFMQYEQIDENSREDLPKPSIDTGMGLERIGAVLQGQHDNYDTDLMRALIEASAQASDTEPDGDAKVHHRVIADHLRSTSFLIADGVMPSNEGRGYVLRRIMRRAMRHAHQAGAHEPLMHRLVPALVGQMGQAFPELREGETLIAETLRLEEERFRKTLERGLRLLDDELERLPESAALPGEVAFRLYDTYGFPLDLTQDALRERGRTVEVAGFNDAMAEQKAKARAAWAGSGDAADAGVWFDIRERAGATEFLGYDRTEAEGEVVAILVEGQPVERAQAGQEAEVVANQTPFYGEAGGQVGDTGTFVAADATFAVGDTKKRLGDLIVHRGRVEEGALSVGNPVRMTVDAGRRAAIRANHSATHLLHEALRGRLGAHVAQRGSLVAPDRLRFDVSHPQAMSLDDLRYVEREVNALIRQNAPVGTRLMTPDDAKALGAQALFGEKYGDEVRVVAMGRQEGSGRGTDGATYSIELCGGTHVGSTGEIGLFVTVGESAAAAGIRRIEALTGEAALEHLSDQDHRLADIALALKAPPQEVGARVRGLLDERKTMQNELADLRKRLALAESAGGGEGDAPAVETVGGVPFLARALSGVSGKDLRGLVDEHKTRMGSGAVLLVADAGGKAAVAAGVTNDLTGTVSAVDLVRAAAEALGGKGGGGRPDMAQAGGPDPSKADEAIRAARAVLEAAA